MIATATGWTWDQIDRLTLPKVYDLEAYWTKHPPVHLLVAAYLDYKPPASAINAPKRKAAAFQKTREQKMAEFARLMARCGFTGQR